jgi:hypothetical protein
LAVQAARGAKMEPFKTGRQYVIKTPPVGGRPTSIYGPGGAKGVAERQVENVRSGLVNLARDIPPSRPPSGQLELDLGIPNRDIDPGTLQSIREIARRAKGVTKDPRSEEMLVKGLLGPQGSRFEFMDVRQPGMRAPSIPKGKSSPAKTPDSNNNNNLVRDVFLGSAALGATAGLSNLLGRDDLSSIEFKEGGRGLPQEVIKESFLVEPTSISRATTVVGGVPGQRPPSRITRSFDDGFYEQAVQNANEAVRSSMPGTTGAIPPTVSQQSPENVNVPVITTPMGTNTTKSMVGNSKEAAAVAVDNADPAILEATKPRMAVGLARTPLQAVTQSRNALGSRVMDIRDLY